MEMEPMDVSSEVVKEENPKEHSVESKPYSYNALPQPIVRVPVKHGNLGIRSHAMDMSTMVELTSFSTLGKIQPFLVTVSANAAIVVDIHCHLIDKEVCGYLGGHWDINTHTLSILGAYPCRYSGKDKTAAAAVEAEIAKAMEWKRMILVGWYHSHPRSHASPSLRDVDLQLDYEIKMKGNSDNGYLPCVALISAPYNTDANAYESNFNIFWSMPPPENRPHEYPRPMLLTYTLSQEEYISQDALEEIKKCIEYYKVEGGIDFTAKFNNNVTYLEKLKNSLASKLPGRNNKTNGSYWDLIKEMICPGYDDGSDSLFMNMKFPLATDSVKQLSAANLFMAPSINSKAESSAHKLYNDIINEENHRKESISLSKQNQSSQAMSSADIIPTFRAGELTVSVKNAKSEFNYNLPNFSKNLGQESKSRNDYQMPDLSQTMKFPDFSNLSNFSPADLAKISGFSLNDFTKAAQSSAYIRNITNLFGPLGKGMPEATEIHDRRQNEFQDALASQFKPSTTSSPMPDYKRVNNTKPEDFSIDRKKLSESMESAMYSGSEDLSMKSSKTADLGTTLDMSIKKHHLPDSDYLDLSKDRQ